MLMLASTRSSDTPRSPGKPVFEVSGGSFRVFLLELLLLLSAVALPFSSVGGDGGTGGRGALDRFVVLHHPFSYSSGETPCAYGLVMVTRPIPHLRRGTGGRYAVC